MGGVLAIIQGVPDLEGQLDDVLHRSYHFSMSKFNFIPIGDSAYSYMVEDNTGERRYLKVFDTTTRKGHLGVIRLQMYAPLMTDLWRSALFTELPRPHQTVDGRWHCNCRHYSLAMFEYIDGETLANAYPFSNEIQRRLATQLANLHQIRVDSLLPDIHREAYHIDFGQSLHSDLEVLKSYNGTDDAVLKLQSLVVPNLSKIDRFWRQLCDYRHITVHSNEPLVLCHGDVWGGNVMQRTDQTLCLLDWEGTLIAPKERDLFTYVGEDYAAFQAAYFVTRGQPLSVNTRLVGFYAYRQQLSNLAQWIHNLLHEDYGVNQRLNDLEMIEFHCLNRWSSVESTIMGLH